jgi:hypothetical protein
MQTSKSPETSRALVYQERDTPSSRRRSFFKFGDKSKDILTLQLQRQLLSAPFPTLTSPPPYFFLRTGSLDAVIDCKGAFIVMPCNVMRFVVVVVVVGHFQRKESRLELKLEGAIGITMGTSKRCG